jgi:Rhodanese-related sulfurtransferase
MYLVVIFVVVVIVAWAMKGKLGNDAYQTVGVDEFETLIADKDSVVVLDVRTPSEYDEAHILGAINIDVKEDSFKKKALEQLPKDKKIAVYCRSGRRSADASGILAGEGFQVFNLDGGILAWLKAQKPVE